MDNLHLINPLVGKDNNFVMQSLYHSSGKDGNASKFVKQVFAPAHATLVASDTEEGKWFLATFPEYKDQFYALSKGLMRFYTKNLVVEETVPTKETWIPTAPLTLDDPRGMMLMSGWNGPISPKVAEANEWENQVPLRFNMRFVNAYLASKFYLGEDGEPLERERKKREWALEELYRVGEDTHFADMTLPDRRSRTYDRKKHWSHQGDAIEKLSVWFAEAVADEPEGFWTDMQLHHGLTPDSWKAVLGAGSDVECMNKYGPSTFCAALACEEFVTTGKTSFPFSLDHGASGPGYLATIMKRMGLMRIGNLLGGSQEDAYLEVVGWLRTNDRSLRPFEVGDLRGVSKCLARGGIYEGGAHVAAAHMMGLDPDKVARLEAADRLSLESYVEFDPCFYTHPHFQDILDAEECVAHNTTILRSGVTVKDISRKATEWCQRIGMPSLHSGIPTIRPVAKRLREANKAAINTLGEMLSWTFPHTGQSVYKIPYFRNQSDVRVMPDQSYLGFKVRASVAFIDHNAGHDANVSADFIHSMDGQVRVGILLSAKEEGIRVLTNHDDFKVHRPYLRRLNGWWRNSFVHMTGSLDLGTMANVPIEEPKGVSYKVLAKKVPNNITPLVP